MISKTIDYSIRIICTIFIFWVVFMISKGIYMQAINDNNEYIQRQNDKIELSNNNYCIKYYSQYTTANLPVYCLKVFK